MIDPMDPAVRHGGSAEAHAALRTSATGRERVAALDGVRAIGLLLILGFHFGVGWMPGGFVGVDLFYVLSGIQDFCREEF